MPPGVVLRKLYSAVLGLILLAQLKVAGANSLGSFYDDGESKGRSSGNDFFSAIAVISFLIWLFFQIQTRTGLIIYMLLNGGYSYFVLARGRTGFLVNAFAIIVGLMALLALALLVMRVFASDDKKLTSVTATKAASMPQHVNSSGRSQELAQGNPTTKIARTRKPRKRYGLKICIVAVALLYGGIAFALFG